MIAAVPFAAIGSLHAGTFIIFTIAAFFGLCALISYFIASAYENNRRAALAQAHIREQFQELESRPGEAIITAAEQGTPRRLEWPEDTRPDE